MFRFVRSSSCAGLLAAAAIGLAAPAVLAQPIVITGQTREVRGEGVWTDPSGTTMGSGALVDAAPTGDYWSWIGTVNIPGYISGVASQTGGYDGFATITLDAINLSLGGGNAPGTSAAANAEIEFSYTFETTSRLTYTTGATFAVAGPSAIPGTTVEFSGVYTLTGPGGEVYFRYETGPENGYSVAVEDLTGTLQPGEYTLSLVIGGEVTFVAPPDAPNGAGGGGGGPNPIMVFHVEPSACPADWNGDTLINSNDISAFLASWLASVQIGDLVADFNNDGLVNSNDISAFLAAWLAAVQVGC